MYEVVRVASSGSVPVVVEETRLLGMLGRGGGPGVGGWRTLSERAIGMRHAPTPSEARLFEAVRGGRLGVAFRRQVPVLGSYIVDLLAPEVRLVSHVSGSSFRPP